MPRLRRMFTRCALSLFWLGLTAASFALVAGDAWAERPEKPNVIFVMTDDK